jgi:hypothetical protein
MDRYLAIFGIVLAVASLVQTFTRPHQNPKGRVIGAVVVLGLLGVFGNELYARYGESKLLAQRKYEVMQLFQTNSPMSFEQIYTRLNYPDYATASAAVDALVDEHLLHHRPVEVTSSSGTKYVVRVYNAAKFPIP